MIRPHTRTVRLVAALLAVGTLIGAAMPAFAADPSSPGAPWPVPAALPTAPITLPDGTVLPLPPPGATQRESVQAEMATEYADVDIPFALGPPPTVPLAVPGAAMATGGTPGASLLGLADPSVPAGADLAAFPNGLRKEVLGFLPYWMLDASDLQWMQYQLVSTIAFFGVAAKPDGTLATYATGWTAWYSSAMTNVINAAHARGVKVVLTITMMAYDGGAQQASLLGSATARANVVAAIVAAVRDRNADGVNLDFEPVAVAQRDQYTSFVRQLKAALVAAGVGSNVTVCTMGGAATWATGYDLAGLVAPGAADALFVMGYDYSWSGSARAGGVAPMDSPYILDVNESVADYLQVVPANKVIWGVPYYGRTWQTQSNALNALTRVGASGSSVAYWYTGNLSLAAQYGRLWDSVGKVPWFRYYDSGAATWVEGYYDDAVSLAAKWDMVNQRGLLGTGMWTLLMDAGRQELWNLLAAKFVSDTTPPTGGITVLPPVTDASGVLVSWRATDVGSGVLNQSVQYRDRAGGAWTAWLTDTTATSAYFLGQPGHAYEFRVSAMDRNGNRQPWTASPPDPGASLAVGGFATVASDGLNVRSGAGTSFSALDQLSVGDRVAILSGPINAGGYDWYQVQYDFAEWPAADYPFVGWSAAAGGGVPYLVPAVAPTVTTLAPAISGYQVAPRRFSPNGDSILDAVAVTFSLTAPATDSHLDVLSSSGATVATVALGALGAGAQSVSWDGRLTGGSWAPADAYLLRVAVTDATGAHVAPVSGVDPSVLAAWGAVADSSPPAVASAAPTGLLEPTTAKVSVTFNESVVGADTGLRLVDADAETVVPATSTYDLATRRVVLDPTGELQRGHHYRVELTATIRDDAGNPLAPVSWTFSTAASGVTGFDPSRTLSFAAGSHTGYQFNASGQVTAAKSYTLGAASTAATSQRNSVIPAQPGTWFLVDNGIWAGYWMRESSSVYLAGFLDQVTFSPTRSVSFASGSHTGYVYNAAGSATSSKTYSLASSSGAAASGEAVINGVAHVVDVNEVDELAREHGGGDQPVSQA